MEWRQCGRHCGGLSVGGQRNWENQVLLPFRLVEHFGTSNGFGLDDHEEGGGGAARTAADSCGCGIRSGGGKGNVQGGLLLTHFV